MAKNPETSDTGVARNDAYTGMLAISLFALLIGSLLLFLDLNQYSGTPPKLTLPPLPAPGAPVQAKKDGAEKKDDAKAPMPVPMPPDAK